MKYDELIKILRECNDCICEEHCPYHEERNNPIRCMTKIVGDAADAIEELKSQLQKSEEDNINLTGLLAEEHAKHLWIPVTERLPEEGRYVLVAYETIAGVLCHVSMLWTYATGDYYWDGLHGINPTHWMPLPEPPEEETDG